LTSKRLINSRRAEVYRRKLRGFTVGEIAQNLNVSEKTVKRDLAWLKSSNKEWFQDHRELIVRLEDSLGEAVDRREEQVREAWFIYHDNEDPWVKLQALKVVSSIDRQREELLGITGMNVKEMELLKRVEALEEVAKEYRAMTEGASRGGS